MIPASCVFDQITIVSLLDHDPVVADYRTFFSSLDWSVTERWESQHTHRGRPACPIAVYLKAFLIRIREGFLYTTQLLAFLLKHPLLVIELGFPLVLDPTQPFGFDVQQTLPSRFWFGEKLRKLDRGLLTDLLTATVHALQGEIPGLGDIVSFDVKHIYAWVQENNPRAYVEERFDKTRAHPGDPDCALGVKRSTNQQQPDGSVKDKKEYLWGYGSGVAAATTPDYGDVVLAELTQPFNQNDITFFKSLHSQASLALQGFPLHLAADAAFDAWYVYEAAARHGGIAAVPRNQHGHPDHRRDTDGVPFCEKGLRMSPRFLFQHSNGYQAQRFGCPLLFPSPTGQDCPKLVSNHGLGCHKDPNWELGGLQRVLLDRRSPLFRAVYTQRTSCERINSQAKEWGIERARVRNGQSVANLNTLIYLVVNVRALQRARSINASLLSTPRGVR